MSSFLNCKMLLNVPGRSREVWETYACAFLASMRERYGIEMRRLTLLYHPDAKWVYLYDDALSGSGFDGGHTGLAACVHEAFATTAVCCQIYDGDELVAAMCGEQADYLLKCIVGFDVLEESGCDRAYYSNLPLRKADPALWEPILSGAAEGFRQCVESDLPAGEVYGLLMDCLGFDSVACTFPEAEPPDLGRLDGAAHPYQVIELPDSPAAQAGKKRRCETALVPGRYMSELVFAAEGTPYFATEEGICYLAGKEVRMYVSYAGGSGIKYDRSWRYDWPTLVAPAIHKDCVIYCLQLKDEAEKSESYVACANETGQIWKHRMEGRMEFLLPGPDGGAFVLSSGWKVGMMHDFGLVTYLDCTGQVLWEKETGYAMRGGFMLNDSVIAALCVEGKGVFLSQIWSDGRIREIEKVYGGSDVFSESKHDKLRANGKGEVFYFSSTSEGVTVRTYRTNPLGELVPSHQLTLQRADLSQEIYSASDDGKYLLIQAAAFPMWSSDFYGLLLQYDALQGTAREDRVEAAYSPRNSSSILFNNGASVTLWSGPRNVLVAQFGDEEEAMNQPGAVIYTSANKSDYYTVVAKGKNLQIRHYDFSDLAARQVLSDR